MSLPSSEQWRPIPDYEGRYDVSDQGRVRSTRRQGTAGQILATAVSRDGGHHQVSLCRPGEQQAREVHQLVMAAFVGPRPEELEVRHLNGDPSDNRLTNLTYGTRSANRMDRQAHGTDHQVNKTHCPRGHEYTPENTAHRRDRPGRSCRTCYRERRQARSG